MVSSEEMEGLRERIEVGVEGTDDEASDDRYCSVNLEGTKSGEEVAEAGLLVVVALEGMAPPNEADTW